MVQITIVIAYDWAELKQESKLKPSIGSAGNPRPTPGDPPISSAPKNPEKSNAATDTMAAAGEGDFDYEREAQRRRNLPEGDPDRDPNATAESLRQKDREGFTVNPKQE